MNPPQNLRELGKYSTSELRTLLASLESPGIQLLWTLFKDRFELLKEVAFKANFAFGNHLDAVTHGNRLGQKDMMDYVQNLIPKIKEELKLRDIPIDSDKPKS